MLRSLSSPFTLAVSALVLVGCIGNYARSREPYLVQRASFDMACPQASLTVSWLSPGVRGVDGCGKRGTYVFERASGSWLLNSQPAATVTPPAASAASAAAPTPTAP